MHLERFPPSPPIHFDGRYTKTLDKLRRRKASGCYCVMDAKSRAVLYIGESHTGRLFETLTRHFRKWDGRLPEYDRRGVLVSFTITPADKAVELQYAEIQRLKPRDNDIECATPACSKRAAVDRARRATSPTTRTKRAAPVELLPDAAPAPF